MALTAVIWQWRKTTILQTIRATFRCQIVRIHHKTWTYHPNQNSVLICYSIGDQKNYHSPPASSFRNAVPQKKRYCFLARTLDLVIRRCLETDCSEPLSWAHSFLSDVFSAVVVIMDDFLFNGFARPFSSVLIRSFRHCPNVVATKSLS